MSVLIQLSPLETLFWVLTGRGDQILWTEADVREHYRQKRLRGQSSTGKTVKKAEPKQRQTLQTKIADKELLRISLKKTNIAFTENNNRFTCRAGNSDITIAKTRNGNYEFRIVGDGNLAPVQNLYNKLGAEYERQVQQKVCKNIKEKVSMNKAMKIEQEEVLEDNSIVITISV